MSRIIRVITWNALYQNKNREEVKNTEIRYIIDLSIFNLLSVFVLMHRNLNHFPNYPTHRLYFGEVETPYWSTGWVDQWASIRDVNKPWALLVVTGSFPQCISHIRAIWSIIDHKIFLLNKLNTLKSFTLNLMKGLRSNSV